MGRANVRIIADSVDRITLKCTLDLFGQQAKKKNSTLKPFSMIIYFAFFHISKHFAHSTNAIPRNLMTAPKNSIKVKQIAFKELTNSLTTIEELGKSTESGNGM